MIVEVVEWYFSRLNWRMMVLIGSILMAWLVLEKWSRWKSNRKARKQIEEA